MNKYQFLNKLSKEKIDTILLLINELCPPLRKCKYTNEYYLDNIIHVLKNVVSWSSLHMLHPDKPKTHYKTIQDVFLKWTKLGIFELAYEKLLIKHVYIKKEQEINLIIDSTLINNKTGSEHVTYGPNPKKKISKTSFICNDKQQIINATFHKGKEHDIKTIECGLEKMKDYLKNKKVNLIGDKGYVSKKLKEQLQTKNICLITPKKKNQKGKNTEKERSLLKIRYVVENVIQRIKNFNRISVRRDRTIASYKSFTYLAMIIIFKK